MNNLSNTYIAKNITTEDIDILKKSKEDINDGIADVLHLLRLNKLPIIDKLAKLVESKKIKLIVDERLKHANVRWVYDNGVVLVNVTPSAKQKRGLEASWSIPSNELYSYILGGAVFLYSEKLNRDRTYLKDISMIYMEIMGKIFNKATSGYFKGNNELSMFHYIMLRHLFANNKTAIMNPESFCANLANIDSTDLSVLKKKYDDKEYTNLEDVIDNILKEEFSFMEKLNPTGLIHTMSIMVGATNGYMLENIDTIGALMCDNVMGNRLSLYAKHPSLKGLFKSTMYNNVIEVLKSV